MVSGGSRVSLGGGVRCLGASAPVPVEVQRQAGTGEVRRRLPAHPLAELILGRGIAQERISALGQIEVLPAGRAAGRGDWRWVNRLTDVVQDPLD